MNHAFTQASMYSYTWKYTKYAWQLDDGRCARLLKKNPIWARRDARYLISGRERRLCTLRDRQRINRPFDFVRIHARTMLIMARLVTVVVVPQCHALKSERCAEKRERTYGEALACETFHSTHQPADEPKATLTKRP